ncbi:MAG: carboxy terminal-processing peptidase [Microscillaceae bacterium]|jgi:carboxyl-terminal processing protease|nr:carboxy terminal-processing peptidase [Microscillaceae bacterium]
MKKVIYWLPLLILPALVWSFTQNNPFKTRSDARLDFAYTLSDTSLLKPMEVHPNKAMILSNIMRYHYSRKSINDEVSTAMFDAYLKSLDNGKVYFLASDVEKFNKYRFELDNLTTEGNVSIAFDIFNVYKQRVLERIDKILANLNQNYDFSTDEYLETDRDKANWAKNIGELDEYWRKYLKSQALSLKLSNKKPDEINQTLKKRYERYRKTITQINSEDVFQTYMNALTETFDPHTNYFSPVSAANFNMNMKKSFEGIGARLQTQDDYTVINEVMPGGPAFKGKELKKGDKIIAVAQGDEGDFEDVIGWRIDDVVSLIRGQKGTTVRLKIVPANSGAEAPPLVIRLVRDKIKIEDESATKKIVSVNLDGKEYKMGVIEIPSFYLDFKDYQSGNPDYKSTSGDVRKLIKELQAEKIDGLMIDLRNNGGGSLKEAIDLTGLFIKKGPVVQVRNTKGEIDIDEDTNPDIVYEGPLAVLVNSFSASASEIFAGAIQDYKRGLILGEQTYGKGTVQSPIDLAQYLKNGDQNQGQINLTLSKFYRVNGSSTQNKGVIPDVVFPALYDRSEVSEAAERAALPWDEIKSSNFDKVNMINADMVDKLNKFYQKQLKNDEDLKKTVRDIEEFKSLRKKTKISLQETKRRQEMAEIEKKQAERKKLEGVEEDDEPSEAQPEPKKDKDTFLKIALDLLAEMGKKK